MTFEQRMNKLDRLIANLRKWEALLEDSATVQEVKEAYAMIDFFQEEIERVVIPA